VNQLQSRLPLQVYWLDEAGDEHAGGTTVGGQSVEVPEADLWFVEPRAEMHAADWDELVAQVRALRIPGLRSGGYFSDYHLGRIGELSELVYLDLSSWNAGITDAGLQCLFLLGKLQYLNLNLNSANNADNLVPAVVSDVGLEGLRFLPRLTDLRLDNLFSVTDRGIANLKGHRHLRTVTFDCTMAGDGALEILSGKEGLSHIHVGPMVTDRGLACLRDYPGLRTGGQATLNLSRCYGITDAGLAHLSDLHGVRSLNLAEARLLNRWASHMPAEVDGRPKYTAAGIGYLGQMAGLQEVQLCGAKLDDAVMAAIGQLPHLTSLSCGGAVATDEGFKALAECASLERLMAYSCHGLGSEGIVALAGLPRLQFFYVGGHRLDDEALSGLCGFGALMEFWTGNDNIFTDEAFAHIAKAPQLDRLLNMYCPTTGDRSTEYVVTASKLRRYSILSAGITDYSFELLAQMEALEYVVCQNVQGITDSGLQRLTQAPRLRHLQVHGCAQISAEGAAAIGGQIQVDFRAR